jgi:hypothetical protein
MPRDAMHRDAMPRHTRGKPLELNATYGYRLHHIWLQARLARDLLELNVTFLFADIDVVLLRDPLPYLRLQLQARPLHTLPLR